MHQTRVVHGAHRFVGIGILIVFGSAYGASGGGGGPAATRLHATPMPDYATCRASYPQDKSHWSGPRTFLGDDGGKNVIIEMAPAHNSHLVPDDKLKDGHLVGFINNTGEGVSKTFAVKKGTPATPSVACVWVSGTPGNYEATLYSNDNPAEYSHLKVDWNDHRPPLQQSTPVPHPYSCAAWRDVNNYSPCYPGPNAFQPLDQAQPVDGQPKQAITEAQDGMTVTEAVAYGLWVTCSTDGCCRIKS